MRLVLATGNAGKAAEIRLVLRTVAGLEVLDRPADLVDPEEDGDTLEANARIKARAVLAATGEAAVADDTGLEVEALGGRPGVHTARYAGPAATYEDNWRKLLHSLSMHHEPEQRRARWRTVALVAYPDDTELAAEGTCEGTISLEPRGDRGFGYDPVFVPDADPEGRTFAELPIELKTALSHRGAAFRALAEAIAPRP